ncbi:MAG: glycoside hydrolase domain-containing protein, partial [Ignavibacteria bacterium]
VNQPWKTQQLIHKINTEFYKNDPDGLIGNEDCGQMSAWYVMSAMGIYSVCPGQLQYAIGTPQFKKVTIHLENGKKFVITTGNHSENNYYIQSAKLNGMDYSKCYLNHSDIMNGGELVFKMGPAANKSWGSGDNDAPETVIKGQTFVPDPYIESDGKTFNGITSLVLKSDFQGAAIYYTTDTSEPTMSSQVYKEPIKIQNTATIKCFAFVPEFGKSKIIQGTFHKIPEGRSVTLNSTPAPKYSAGGPDALIDLIRGKRNWRLGDWMGFEGQDFDAVADLGREQKINKIGLGCLMDVWSWIWFPSKIEFSVSSDGVKYSDPQTVNIEMPPVGTYKLTIQEYIVDVNKEIRYIKVHAYNLNKIPAGYPGEGEKMWIFMDEIIVE